MFSDACIPYIPERINQKATAAVSGVAGYRAVQTWTAAAQEVDAREENTEALMTPDEIRDRVGEVAAAAAVQTAIAVAEKRARSNKPREVKSRFMEIFEKKQANASALRENNNNNNSNNRTAAAARAPTPRGAGAVTGTPGLSARTPGAATTTR